MKPPMSERKQSNTERVIAAALDQGYRVDLEAGAILGKGGQPLRLSDHPYPRASLCVKGFRRRSYAVPAHKVVAFAKFGAEAFAPGLHVRHRDGNKRNLRGSNLLMGTPPENAMDKPAHVRKRIAQIARAAQGDPANRVFSGYQARKIRAEFRAGVGVCELARRHKCHHATISRIVNGKSYRRKK